MLLHEMVKGQGVDRVGEAKVGEVEGGRHVGDDKVGILVADGDAVADAPNEATSDANLVGEVSCWDGSEDEGLDLLESVVVVVAVDSEGREGRRIDEGEEVGEELTLNIGEEQLELGGGGRVIGGRGMSCRELERAVDPPFDVGVET